jgi:phospholipid/cholesterol/gamma-HCH transport system substrate-binding protein
MGTHLRRLELGLAFAAVVGAGLALGHLLPSPAPYQLRVPIENAAGLAPGSDVMIAGASAGRVQAIALAPGSALVTITVDAEHAPVQRDATVGVRPKSLLGERYLALDPGQAAGTLPSGATLPPTAIVRSTDLEDVVNTFDQPTRDKLQTLVVELGGGVAGRGQELNAGLAAGRQDLDSLRGIASTLASRDAELRDVIANLDSVTGELARSDRAQQLGVLIQNLEALLHNLADQEAQLRQALAASAAALTRTGNALDGTGGSLADIAQELPQTVRLADLVMADLGPDSDVLMPHMGQIDTAIAEGPTVFGGRDASGYATRIAPIVGCATVTDCRLLESSQAADFLLGRPAPATGTAGGGRP